MTPSCEQFADDLSAYIDGELETDRAAQVEQHVAACDACRSTVESLRRVSSGLAELSHERAPGHLLAAVRREVHGGKGEIGRRAPGSSFASVYQPMVLRVIAAAALIVIGVFVSRSVIRSTSPQDPTPTVVHGPAFEYDSKEMPDRAAAPREQHDRKQEMDASTPRMLQSPGYLADVSGEIHGEADELPIDVMQSGAELRAAPTGGSVMTITVAPRDDAEYRAALAVLAAARVQRLGDDAVNDYSRDKDANLGRRTAGLEHVKSGRFEMLMVSAEEAERLIVSFEQVAPRQVSVEKGVADAGVFGAFYLAEQTATPAARAIARSKESTTDELAVAGAPVQRSLSARPTEPRGRRSGGVGGARRSETPSRSDLEEDRRAARGLASPERMAKSGLKKDIAARKLKDRSVADAPARQQARENAPGDRVRMFKQTTPGEIASRLGKLESPRVAASQPAPAPSSAPTAAHTPATSRATFGEVRLRVRIMPPPGAAPGAPPPVKADTTDPGGK